MATKTCSKGQNQFRVCEEGRYCDPRYVLSDDNPRGRCDPNGCSWNTYRISSQDFYGKGKLVDTSKKFTCVKISPLDFLLSYLDLGLTDEVDVFIVS